MRQKFSKSIIYSVICNIVMLGVGCQQSIPLNTTSAPLKNIISTSSQNLPQPNTFDERYNQISTSTAHTAFFEDKNLGINFVYPQEWGTLQGQLTCSENHNNSGCNYTIINQDIKNTEEQTNESIRLQAGGRSSDYVGNNEGSLLDTTRSLAGKSPTQVCQLFHAIECVPISDQIISMTVVPHFEDICPPSPAQFTPNKIVVLRLSTKSKMQNIIIAYNFLSTQSSQDLYTTLGKNALDCYSATTAAREAFNSKAEAVISAVKAGTLDYDSQRRIEEFDSFAKTIKISN